MDGVQGQKQPKAGRLQPNWFRRNWLRLLVNLGALVLLARLGWWIAGDRFFFDPVKEITIRTGRHALTLLLLTLTCTPLALLTGWSRLRRARRPLGLWSLGFATLHVLTFAGWDYRFDPALLRIGVFSQPFVLVGLGAFLLLAIPGVYSIPRLRKRAGRAWIWVQRLVYLAVILDVWHVVWAKKNILEAWQPLAIVIVLLLLRIPLLQAQLVRLRKAIRGSEAA